MPRQLPTSNDQLLRSRPRRAFTLIEILVVVAIIIILAGILISVGLSVKANAAIRSTHTTLKTLEGIMADYLKDGNPEPKPPTTWPYPSPNPPVAYAVTNPASDPIEWVIALRANPLYAKKLESLVKGSDGLTSPTGPNVTILDAWGTPIRYVPYDSTSKKEGYFLSAGPDRNFTSETLGQFSPAPTAVPTPDDLYSTDP